MNFTKNSISKEGSLKSKLHTEAVTHYVRTDSAITLVALVVTIIVLLILAAVSLNLITGSDGILGKATKASVKTSAAAAKEQIELFLAECKADYYEERYVNKKDVGTMVEYLKNQIPEEGKTIGDYYVTIDENAKLIAYAGNTSDAIKDENKLSSGTITEDGKIGWVDKTDEWDLKAAPQTAFLWKSDDPESPDYGVITGYTSEVQKYSTLRVPTRCTKIIVNNSLITPGETMRSFTQNIIEVELPNTVTEISGSSEYNFSKLEKIIIPDSVTTIGARTFSGCTGLKSIIIPDSVTTIGFSAFEDCTGLKSIIIPNSVTIIDQQTFENCTSLTSIEIPDSVTEIKTRAFGRCTGLTSVEIPDSVTAIGNTVFDGCTNLTSITFRGTTYTDKTTFNEYLVTEGIARDGGDIWK